MTMTTMIKQQQPKERKKIALGCNQELCEAIRNINYNHHDTPHKGLWQWVRGLFR